ncbi:hypothetical protein [Micromonospora sp. NPDC126480]|uniref:hypothetical protein n=1 Tax=Micromonospora sp. NPDC126480 TaxID=3155312 RepID=UPI003318A5C9
MAYTPPWQRLCDCPCPQHHGHQRTTYNDDRCACVTCTTQPTTLITEHWNCALFLDLGGDLWFVNRLPGGQWDWPNADHAHEHHDFYAASLSIERQLRQTVTHPAQPLRAEPPGVVAPNSPTPMGLLGRPARAAHGPFAFHDLARDSMYRTYRNAYERSCDCTGPTHHGASRARSTTTPAATA